MNKFSVTAAAVALASTTSIANAQASFDDMLNLFEAGAKAEGATVTFSDRIVGGDGSVEYRDFSITDPDDGVTIATDWIKGTPASDDAATITFTVADTISISGNAEGEPINFEIRSDDLEITTNALLAESHDISDITVAFMADSFIVEGGDSASEVIRAMLIDFEDINFSGIFSMADMTAEGSLTSGELKAVYDMSMDGQVQKVNQTSDSFEMAFDLDVPQGERDTIGFLDGSKNGTLTFTSGKSVFDNSITQDGMEFAYSGSTEGGNGNFSMLDGTLTYDITNGAVDVAVVPGAGVPMPPFDVSLSAFEWEMIFPLNSADEPATAIVDLLLADLTVGEGVWSMIDPEQTISRDPATLDIDLDAVVQIDAVAAGNVGANPFDAATFHSVNINQVLLSIGGAELQADGAATFDNSGPFPMPLGAVNVSLSGAQTLADQLVQLGLVDQMQVGMLMGMIMAFAKPDGDDKFVSEITSSEDGIFANGQPLR